MKYLNIFIHQEVIDFIEQNSSQYSKVETGGVIGGTGSVEKGNVIIKKASEGGPKAIRKKYFFSRDTKHCQKVVDDWSVTSNGQVDYLGEWHKHLEKIPHPSVIDIATMKNVSISKDYHITCPILIIIGKSNKANSMKVFVISDKGKWLEIKWQIYQIEPNTN